MEAPGTILDNELRRSLRIQGINPPFGLLPDSQRRRYKMTKQEKDGASTSVGSTPVPAFFTYQIPRSPAIFSGDELHDPQKWLKDYARIATYNRWDDSLKLANVVFYLEGTARAWFDNNEEALTSWDLFESKLTETFGRADEIKRRADDILRTRAQQNGETSEAYIQHILSLCRRVNPDMPEEDKIGHLMKGIAEDLYNTLIVRDVSTVEEFISHCRKVDSMRRKRVTPRFARLPNVAQTSSINDFDSRDEDLPSTIRKIVREEMKKLLPDITSIKMTESPSFEDIIREEVRHNLAPLTAPAGRYNHTSSMQKRRNEIYRGISPSGAKKTDVWRTNDNVPICFHCGRAGHVLRYCRDRRRVFAASREQRQLDDSHLRDTDSIPEYGRETDENAPRYRSSSPYPRRTPFRRQSQSPSRRNSRSPRRSNEGN